MDSSKKDISESEKMDIDENVEMLKQRLVKSKLSFTAQKNRVLYQLCDEECSEPTAVEESIELMLSAQEEVIGVIADLSQLCSDKKDFKMLKTMTDEMDWICEESIDTQEKACKSVQSMCSQQKIGPLSNIEKSDSQVKLQREIDQLRAQVMTLKDRNYTGSEVNNRGFGSTDPDHKLGSDLWNQLERVSIPVFNGDKGTYEGWKSAFIACVDDAPVSEVYKLLQLKKYLAGEPLKLIERLGHSASAYRAAKDKLERKYGGKRRQIAMYLKQLEAFDPLKDGDSKSFEAFADLLETAMFTLKEAGRLEELGNGTLYSTLLKKLSDKQMVEYLRWIDEKHIEESVESLTKWSLRESEFCVISAETRAGFGTSSQKAYFVREKVSTGHAAANGRFSLCGICRGKHGVTECEVFKSMDYSDRWQAARDHGLCFRCLNSQHIGVNCKRSIQCGIQGCKNTHHRLLHRMRDTPTESGEDGKCQTSVCSLRTVPVVLKNNDTQVKVNALLDDASTKSYINADIAKKLGLTGCRETVNVSVLNGKSEIIDSLSVAVGLQSLDGRVDRRIMVNTVDSVTGDLSVVNWNQEACKWPHLKDIPFPQPAEIDSVDILIGLDHPDLHVSGCDIRGKWGEPSARKTRLGWTCVSPPLQN